MPLLLGERRFEIQGASLWAILPDPYWLTRYHPSGSPSLSWSLEIQAQKAKFDDEMWAPCLTHEHLRFPARRWTDLAGERVEWHTPCDQHGTPNGVMYVFGHEQISRGTLLLGERDQRRFRVTWEGLCDVFWDDEYGQNVPFSVEAWAEFTGVQVNGSGSDSPESVRARLSEYLDLSDLVQQSPEHVTHYEDGMSATSTRFTPQVGTA